MILESVILKVRLISYEPTGLHVEKQEYKPKSGYSKHDCKNDKQVLHFINCCSHCLADMEGDRFMF